MATKRLTDAERIEQERKEFHDLTREREAILVKLEPLQAERDKLRAMVQERMDFLHAEIKKLNAPLYDIDRRRGRIARGLNGKTGAPGDYPEKKA